MKKPHVACGITCYGSKKVTEVFQKYEAEFLEASLSDTVGLNDEDQNTANSFLLASIDEENGVMGSVVSSNSVPLLPWPVDLMNEQECVKYVLPELRKDIAENKGISVSRINWGSEEHHPECWADDLAPWKNVGNANHTQTNKFDVLKSLVDEVADY